MTDADKKYLSDIIIAIAHINQFILVTPSFKLYAQDFKTKSAVERQLGIIGEAVNQFSKKSSSPSVQHAKQIISLRNR